MRESYFGDSYDVVKQSLLRWLQPFGDWEVHPMFSVPASSAFISAFGTFLNAKVISEDVLTSVTDRSVYFSSAHSCGNLFLDPDTGICLESKRGVRAPKYLFLGELVRLADLRPNCLTVVFDQSVPRGSEEMHIAAKLRSLHDQKISAFAYRSHACFIVVGRDYSLVDRAYKRIVEESRLPNTRFLRLGAN